jgi:DNA-binding transcriptional regulator YhcF (GntR family)
LAVTNDRGTGGQKLYETIRDQLISDIRSGVYPAGALLPSVREITVRWTVSTTTARKVLAELVTAGYVRAEGTRGHVSSGVPPHQANLSDSAAASDDLKAVRSSEPPAPDVQLGREGDPHPVSPEVGLDRLRDFEVVIWQLTALPWRARAAAIRAVREEESKIAAERDTATRSQR